MATWHRISLLRPGVIECKSQLKPFVHFDIILCHPARSSSILTGQSYSVSWTQVFCNLCKHVDSHKWIKIRLVVCAVHVPYNPDQLLVMFIFCSKDWQRLRCTLPVSWTLLLFSILPWKCITPSDGDWNTDCPASWTLLLFSILPWKCITPSDRGWNTDCPASWTLLLFLILPCNILLLPTEVEIRTVRHLEHCSYSWSFPVMYHSFWQRLKYGPSGILNVPFILDPSW